MKTALLAVLLILGGLVGFFIGAEPFVRAMGLGLAVTGVIMLIVQMIEGEK
jgi:hypothetical protein